MQQSLFKEFLEARTFRVRMINKRTIRDTSRHITSANPFTPAGFRLLWKRTMPVRSDQRSASAALSQPCESTDFVESILRVSQQIRRLLNEQLEVCDLNDVRYAVLSTVSRSAERGGCSQSELAARLDQSESSVSMLIDRMRADRLLHRLHAPTDRRRRRLVLTEEGRDLIQRANRVYAGFVDALLCAFDGEPGLKYQLNKLSATLGEPGFAASLRHVSTQSVDATPPADSRQPASPISTSAAENPPGISPAA